MGDDDTIAAHVTAQAMLDIFTSVGADHFGVTRTTAAGDKDWFRRGVSLADLTRTLPAMLDAAKACITARRDAAGPSGLQDLAGKPATAHAAAGLAKSHRSVISP
jgi:hypothetical protein